MSLPAVLLLTGLVLAPGATAAPVLVTVGPQPARATYTVGRTGERGPAIRPHRAAGYVQRVRLLPGGLTEVTVLVEPLPPHVPGPWPVSPDRRPTHVNRWLEPDGESPGSPVVERLGRDLAAGARWEHEVAWRILHWVSTEVEPVAVPGHDDSAAAALGTRRASCVGRSRLAVALLRAAGLPARTVHGLVVPSGTPPGAPLGSADFTLHRFLETWLSGLGWLPSDPGESIHVVDTRHLVLALDHEPYDPERQRLLRITAAPRPTPLRAEQEWPADRRVLLVRPLHLLRPGPAAGGTR